MVVARYLCRPILAPPAPTTVGFIKPTAFEVNNNRMVSVRVVFVLTTAFNRSFFKTYASPLVIAWFCAVIMATNFGDF